MSTLTFTTPPPGLAPLVDFGLDAVDGAKGLYTLQSIKDPSKRMYVVDAAVYAPDYSPAFSRGSLDDLAAGTDPQVLVIATAAAGQTPTVNLLAPIVVNREDGRCTQVILDGNYPVKAALTGQ
jgi:flagellar assembly factor FliW